MASKLILSTYTFLFYIYNGLFTVFAKIAVDDSPEPYVFYVFVGMMFLPEMALFFSKSFRNWIKQGIENADGKLNKEDVKDMRIHYASIWMLRLFVLFGLLMIFYQMKIDWNYYILPFFGAMGLEGASLLRNLYARPK